MAGDSAVAIAAALVMVHMSEAEFQLDALEIAAATEDDCAAIHRLFEQSIIDGQTHDGDTGADIDNLREAYLSDDGASAFWVARHGDDVIGMVGVQRMGKDEAEIRRLRVDAPYRRRGVGGRLMQTALNFCRDRGYLKVVLDVRIERGPAIALFEKFGFTPGRSREVAGRKLLDFYVDLYQMPNE